MKPLTNAQIKHQHHRFNPAFAAVLDDPSRFAYLPPVRLAEMLSLGPGKRLLDFGTGTGTYAVAIANLHPEIHLTAFDIEPQMLELLRAKLAAVHLSNVQAATKEEILTETFDAVLGLNVLHELADSELSAIGDLLAAKGELLIVDWDADSERSVGPPKHHVHSKTEAAQRLERAGFTIERSVPFPYQYCFLCRLSLQGP